MTTANHSYRIVNMHKILEKKQFSPDVFYFKLVAPEIAKRCKAGQFLLVQIDEEYGERIPLTIADSDSKDGWIALVFQAVGATTLKLSTKNEGESIPVILGPLGRPSHIEKRKHVVCVGGGIGVAPLYPIVKAFKEAGSNVTMIMGARNKELLIFEDEMKAAADNLIVVTDDGSYGRKGLVTEPLKELCESATPPEEVIAIGPPIMMKFCAETTRPFAIPTVVSLNTIMIDGTGMCGGCRVAYDNEIKFVCVDGPDFDGHKVDFDSMMKRMKAFKKAEDEARHRCQLEMQAAELQGAR